MVRKKGDEWKQEELELLTKYWGKKPLSYIAKKLGRTEVSVKLKAKRSGLSGPYSYADGFAINQLARILNTDGHTVKRWITKGLLKATIKTLESKTMYFIMPNDFWTFLYENPSAYNLMKLERNGLGPEPKWTEERRQIDSKRFRPTNSQKWTKEEDRKLRLLVSQNEPVHVIADQLKRSENSVMHRLRRLKEKRRPEGSSAYSLKNHELFTGYNDERLVDAVNEALDHYKDQNVAMLALKLPRFKTMYTRLRARGYLYKNLKFYKPEEVSDEKKLS
jgi:transposase-like protein